MDAASLLEKGKFFSPLHAVWEVESLEKKSCYDTFVKVCRPEGFANKVLTYKKMLDNLSEAKQRNASNEAIIDSRGRPPRDSKKDKKTKDKVGRNNSSASSKSSKSSNKQGKNSDYLTVNGGSVTSSPSDQDSAKTSSSQARNSNASSRSQSMRYYDFSGRSPSTRAHMIPNPKTSDCYKYYTVICQAVLGFHPVDVKLQQMEKLAKGLAESEYNFLRAPNNHGDYFDKKPCWILVPACPLEKIRDWEPGEVYPVLAVACGCRGVTVKEAYRMMCPFGYNDKDFETNYPVNEEEITGFLKRSKCKETEFGHATQNLRQMTLAIAETLVGRNIQVRPDECLTVSKNTVKIEENSKAYNCIAKKLKSEIADEEKGDEETDDNEVESHLQVDHYFHEVQFAETRNSLMNGIKLPKVKENLDLDRCELLQFDVDPNRGLDLYPDPMLLLIKAAVNWSWRCGQKLLPACGCTNEEEEEEEEFAPSTPVPTTIEFKPAPVTPDDNDDLSV